MRPPPPSWRGLIRPPPMDAARRRFREELGLATDRPVIMSGHQPTLWHGGIVAKVFAALAASKQLNAEPAWLVVDQDDVQPSRVEYPAVDSQGRLVRASTHLEADPRETMPAAMPALATRLNRARDAWRTVSQLGNKSDAEIATSLMRAWLDVPESTLPAVLATRLSHTALFSDWVHAMVTDADRCVAAYNKAAATHPHARIRPLAQTGNRAELPLWRIRKGLARINVFADEIARIPPSELAPKALLQTALLRTAGCDLFIHGLGGGGHADGEGYDQVMADWLERWQPASLGTTLAPAVVVSATIRLDWPDEDLAHAQSALNARWRWHHAKHQPIELDEHALQSMKESKVRAIRANTDRRLRQSLFREMHDALRLYRETHAMNLAGLKREADEARGRLSDSELRLDRTWSFVLHSPDTLARLRTQIDAMFAT